MILGSDVAIDARFVDALERKALRNLAACTLGLIGITESSVLAFVPFGEADDGAFRSLVPQHNFSQVSASYDGRFFVALSNAGSLFVWDVNEGSPSGGFENVTEITSLQSQNITQISAGSGHL